MTRSRAIGVHRSPFRYLDPDPGLLLEDANASMNPKFHALNQAVVGLVSRPVAPQDGFADRMRR